LNGSRDKENEENEDNKMHKLTFLLFRHVHCAKASYNVAKAYNLLNVEIIENCNPFFYTKRLG
jgi:hypothetical protein